MIFERLDGRSSRILIVDDERSILDLLARRLTSLGYECSTEPDGLKAIQRIEEGRFDLILLDINMPLLQGTELLLYSKNLDPSIQVVMISGIESVALVRETLREGAFDYLTKPIFFEELELTVKRALDHGYLARQIEDHQRDLERKVAERTKKLVSALERIEKTYEETILALDSALETRDIETKAHGLRVARFSRALAHTLDISDSEQLSSIERGAYLHDIGKIGVPDVILRKADVLTEEEWEIMRRHPIIGRDIIEGIDFLSGSVPIVYSHHESYDGSGYPLGLGDQEIPIDARIFAVADALDAIISHRPYRKARSVAVAKQIIHDDMERQFDPEVVRALMSIPDKEIAGHETTRVRINQSQ